MKVVAVANRKGGVGKTITAYHLAAGFARHKARVLALDIDPQQDLSSQFEAVPSTDELLLDALRGKHALHVIATGIAGVELAPGGRLRDADVEVAKLRESRLYEVLAPLARQYDFAVIDCPPLFGRLTRAAIALADLVVAPVELEVHALHGLRETLTDLARAPQDLIILPTKVADTVLHDDLYKELYAAYGPESARPWSIMPPIPRTIRLGEVAARHRPIWEFEPNSDAASRYRFLVNVVEKHLRGDWRK